MPGRSHSQSCENSHYPKWSEWEDGGAGSDICNHKNLAIFHQKMCNNKGVQPKMGNIINIKVITTTVAKAITVCSYEAAHQYYVNNMKYICKCVCIGMQAMKWHNNKRSNNGD